MIDGGIINKTNTQDVNKAKKQKKKNKLTYTIAIGSIAAITVIGGYTLTKNSEHTKFTYVSDENNNFKAKGKIKYDEVKDWYLVEKKLLNEDHKLFICDKTGKGVFSKAKFNDVTNSSLVGKESLKSSMTYNGDSLVNVVKIEEYLLTYDMIKAYYEIEDIEKLLSLIQEDYNYTSNKELEKKQ